MHGGICHIEIPCKDIKRAKGFYSRVFGWSFKDEGEGYSMFKSPEGVGGALELRKDRYPQERGITLYIEVDDIPEVLKRIKESGGEIVKEKTEISPEFGFFAIFKDTEANILGLWSKK